MDPLALIPIVVGLIALSGIVYTIRNNKDSIIATATNQAVDVMLKTMEKVQAEYDDEVKEHQECITRITKLEGVIESHSNERLKIVRDNGQIVGILEERISTLRSKVTQLGGDVDEINRVGKRGQPGDKGDKGDKGETGEPGEDC